MLLGMIGLDVAEAGVVAGCPGGLVVAKVGKPFVPVFVTESRAEMQACRAVEEAGGAEAGLEGAGEGCVCETSITCLEPGTNATADAAAADDDLPAFQDEASCLLHLERRKGTLLPPRLSRCQDLSFLALNHRRACLGGWEFMAFAGAIRVGPLLFAFSPCMRRQASFLPQEKPIQFEGLVGN